MKRHIFTEVGGRKIPRASTSKKPLSQRATGTREGNLVKIHNHASHNAPFPIAGPANSKRFTVGRLVTNVLPNANRVKVHNSMTLFFPRRSLNNLEYLVPIKNLNFSNKNLKKLHNVEITTSLPDLPSYRGVLAEDFNGEKIRFMGAANKSKKSVNAGNVISFINYDWMKKNNFNKMAENLLLTEAELFFVNHIKEDDAQQLFKKVFRMYSSLQEKELGKQNALSSHPRQMVSTRNREDPLIRNVYHKRAYLSEILNKLLDRFPHLVKELPDTFFKKTNLPFNFVPYDTNTQINFFMGNSKNLPAWMGKQLKKQIAHPSNISSMKKKNMGGSSAKPKFFPASRRVSKTKLPIIDSNYIELHHIVSGEGPMEWGKKIGDVIKFDGPTYWHSDEFWDWNGLGNWNVKPLARLVGKFNKNDNNLISTGRYSTIVNGKMKGAFVYNGPLELHIDAINKNINKPVYFVHKILPKSKILHRI